MSTNSDVGLNVGKVKVSPGETVTFAKIVETSFIAHRLVFDGNFEGGGVLFNLYVDRESESSVPFMSSQHLRAGDVFRIEIINESKAAFDTTIRLFGRSIG